MKNLTIWQAIVFLAYGTTVASQGQALALAPFVPARAFSHESLLAGGDGGVGGLTAKEAKKKKVKKSLHPNDPCVEFPNGWLCNTGGSTITYEVDENGNLVSVDVGADGAATFTDDPANSSPYQIDVKTTGGDFSIQGGNLSGVAVNVTGGGNSQTQGGNINVLGGYGLTVNNVNNGYGGTTFGFFGSQNWTYNNNGEPGNFIDNNGNTSTT